MKVPPVCLPPTQDQILALITAAVAAFIPIAALIFLTLRIRFYQGLTDRAFVLALVDPRNDAGGVEGVSTRQLSRLLIFLVPIHAYDAVVLNHGELVSVHLHHIHALLDAFRHKFQLSLLLFSAFDFRFYSRKV